jgi:anti-sigma B factor antagonist
MDEITIKDSLKITPMLVGENSSTVQLVLNGYLDTYNSPEFQSHINGMINSGMQCIIFNCNGLNYISSTGIGAFTAFLKLLKQKKGEMALFGLQKKVMEVFQLLGFTKFFKIGSSFEEALGMTKGEVKVEQKPAAEAKPLFPLIFHCPHCDKKLKSSKPGKFRCSGCKGVIEVDEKGTVLKG